jgi:hypothetical protein
MILLLFAESQFSTARPLLYFRDLAPPLEEIVVDIHQIEYLAHGLIDDILYAPGGVVEGRNRR